MQPEPEIFNLIDAPWLPVRRRSGTIERIPPWRINDGLAEDPFVAFAWPRPDFDGAAHEFMIGLLSTAAAPENDSEWEGWWSCPPTPDVLERKFAPLAPAFCVDGPGPRFMQDLDPLDDADDREVATLLIDAPGAQTLRNNADLFVKRGNAPVLCRAAAAMALYTLNSYAPSGGQGHRTSLRGGGPMTTLVVADHDSYGHTLWGRLWPNVETREQIEDRATDAYPKDDIASMFPWLVATRVSNPKAGGRETTQVDIHPLQVYWGMPRRIRLLFEEGRKRTCSLTDETDQAVITHYRTKNYGIQYFAEGFEHPLTPYYRNKSGGAKLPFHPNPGGINYRLWPGLVVPSRNKLRQPAQVIRKWPERGRSVSTKRFTAYGYDMDNMKARDWVEGEWPLWLFADKDLNELFAKFIGQITAGSDTVSWSLMSAVKSALHDSPSDARGDYGFIAERFFRETESQFYDAVREATTLVTQDVDDPTLKARISWMSIMTTAALHLFDEYAPTEGLEDRNMQRHVKARFFLLLTLGGHGKTGRSLYGRDLEIPSPKADVARKESS